MSKLQRWTQGSGGDTQSLPLQRAGKLEDVAKCVQFLLSNQSSYVTVRQDPFEKWLPQSNTAWMGSELIDEHRNVHVCREPSKW